MGFWGPWFFFGSGSEDSRFWESSSHPFLCFRGGSFAKFRGCFSTRPRRWVFCFRVFEQNLTDLDRYSSIGTIDTQTVEFFKPTGILLYLRTLASFKSAISTQKKTLRRLEQPPVESFKKHVERSAVIRLTVEEKYPPLSIEASGSGGIL